MRSPGRLGVLGSSLLWGAGFGGISSGLVVFLLSVVGSEPVGWGGVLSGTLLGVCGGVMGAGLSLLAEVRKDGMSSRWMLLLWSLGFLTIAAGVAAAGSLSGVGGWVVAAVWFGGWLGAGEVHRHLVDWIVAQDVAVRDLDDLERQVVAWSPIRRGILVGLARSASGSWGLVSSIAGHARAVRSLMLLQACGKDVLGQQIPTGLTAWNDPAYHLLKMRPSPGEVRTLERFGWGLEHPDSFRGARTSEWVRASQLLQTWVRFPHASRSPERLEHLSPVWGEVVKSVASEHVWGRQNSWDRDEARSHHGAQQAVRDAMWALALLDPQELEVALQVIGELNRSRFSGPDTFLQQVSLVAQSVRGAFPGRSV